MGNIRRFRGLPFPDPEILRDGIATVLGDFKGIGILGDEPASSGPDKER